MPDYITYPNTYKMKDETIEKIKIMSYKDKHDIYDFLRKTLLNVVETDKPDLSILEADVNNLVTFVSGKIGLDLRKNDRAIRYVFSRNALISIVHEYLHIKLKQGECWSLIGRCLKKDHASIMHSYKVHIAEMNTENEQYKRFYKIIKDTVSEYDNIPYNI